MTDTRARVREEYRDACRLELMRFLRRLPEQERLLLVLRYGYGLTDGEIGRVLDLPEQRVTYLRTVTRLRASSWLPPGPIVEQLALHY